MSFFCFFLESFQRFSPPVCFVELPARATSPATNGEEMLVPSTVIQPLSLSVSYSAAPTATAPMSEPVRYEHFGSFCHEGFDSSVDEQPPPEKPQTISE